MWFGHLDAILLVGLTASTLEASSWTVESWERANELPEQCYEDGVAYSHMEEFSYRYSRCIQYRCNNGIKELIAEGCELGDQCHPVNSTYSDDACRTYKCTKEFEFGLVFYNSLILTVYCQNYRRACYAPGTKFWHPTNYQMLRCTCMGHDYVTANYTCTTRLTWEDVEDSI
ncbi:hypothetical protein BsWGS_03417 [Bradybaena similaris]